MRRKLDGQIAYSQPPSYYPSPLARRVSAIIRKVFVLSLMGRYYHHHHHYHYHYYEEEERCKTTTI